MCKKIESGIYLIPLTLSPSLEGQRLFLEKLLLQAQRVLKNFVIKNNWSHLFDEPLIHSATIYDTQEELTKQACILAGLPLEVSEQLPTSFAACIENKHLCAVSPTVYEKIYPEGIEKDAFQKLLTHELAHQLHIRLLDGNEDAMGPAWFFEGFALYVAGQFNNYTIELDKMLQIINDMNPIGSIYAQYSALFRHLVSKVSIDPLLSRAGEENFHQWVKEVISEKPEN